MRAMQAHGWLERCRLRPEAWLDPRRLTEAGKEALARIKLSTTVTSVRTLNV